MVNFTPETELTLQCRNGNKCCFIDSASVISGIAKFTSLTLKKRRVSIDIQVFIWFVMTLFVNVLTVEKENHGNNIFICVVRECSIIPKDVLIPLGLGSDTHYICKMLYRMKDQIKKKLGNCTFMIVGAHIQDERLVREVDDAVCIALSSIFKGSRILTCDSYRSFLKKPIQYDGLVVKKCRSGCKFKKALTFSSLVSSCRYHGKRANTFRRMIIELCEKANYDKMYTNYVKLKESGETHAGCLMAKG